MRLLCTIPITIIALSLYNAAAATPRFLPPAARPVEEAAQPWLKNRLVAIAWHDVSDDAPDQEHVAVRTSRLIEQQIGRAHVELQSLMRISYAVFCLKKKKNTRQL